MQYVFMLDHVKKPLDPCHPARARQLLSLGQAAVFRHFPFTIILKNRTQEESTVNEQRVKIDPGSKTTGIALVNESSHKIVWAAEIEHRGQIIHDRLLSRRAIRKNRRCRNTRYRPARFNNRLKPEGWLPPSQESRIANIQTWVNRLSKFALVTSISMELVKFDTQAMENPEISGIEYQQGELTGYEIGEYLLEKWEHKCAYCGAINVPLEIEHIVPKSRGGSNRVSNLSLACHNCNQAKGNRTAAEFGYIEIQTKAKWPLKDAAVINATRWALWRKLSTLGLPVECGSGGRTKYNRTRQELPKTHWLDAACVGSTGEKITVPGDMNAISIKAMGHGKRQRSRMNKYGFPIAYTKGRKYFLGFQTGDLVKAIILKGKYKGTHIGRISIRFRPCFKLNGFDVNPKYLRKLQSSDGYEYLISTKK